MRVWTAELLEEVLPPSVGAAVSESVMVEAASLLMALVFGVWEFLRDDRLIDDVVEKASAPCKPMASSVKAAAAATST